MIEKPRARRYPFAASIELVEMESGAEVYGQNTDISSFGCQVNVVTPWTVGTKVRLRIVHRGAVLSAQGTVTHMRGRTSLGVAFTQMEEKEQSVLDKWLADLRDTHERAATRR